MSFGKYHINGYRFVGLTTILTAFLLIIIGIGDFTIVVIESNTSGAHSSTLWYLPERIYGVIAIFIGSLFLSLEKKE